MFDLKSLVQTPFVIVGGVATRLYAAERVTEDLDVLILTRDAGQFYAELQQAGCRREGSLAVGGSHWRLPNGVPLNVRESQERWAEEAIRHPVAAPDGLPVIALPYLVLMKMRSSRGIDIGDLARMLGAGDEESLRRVRAVIRAYLPDAAEDLESLIRLGRLEYET